MFKVICVSLLLISASAWSVSTVLIDPVTNEIIHNPSQEQIDALSDTGEAKAMFKALKQTGESEVNESDLIRDANGNVIGAKYGLDKVLPK